MNLLIRLKVRYGFPVNALYGFLKNNDYEIWKNYLKNISCEFCINQEEGQIFLFVRDCADILEVKNELAALPLITEEFIDIAFLEFANFKSLTRLFESAPYTGCGITN